MLGFIIERVDAHPLMRRVQCGSNVAALALHSHPFPARAAMQPLETRALLIDPDLEGRTIRQIPAGQEWTAVKCQGAFVLPCFDERLERGSIELHIGGDRDSLAFRLQPA